MQHVFSLGSVFRASPFVNYHHQPSSDMDAPPITTIPNVEKESSPPAPPPPQQKLLIKLRVSDLGTKPRAPPDPNTDVDELFDDNDDAPVPVPTPTTKRRGGGTGTRGKRRKVEPSTQPGTPTSDDGLSVAWDSGTSASGTPTKRGRGKGSRGGGGGRGRGGRKSGLQHQVLPITMPGTPDSLGELQLRPGSPSSASTSNLALTPTPISTPTIPIPVPLLPHLHSVPPASLSTSTPAPLPTPAPAEIDPALLATAPRRPLPTRAFPVQPAPKTTQPTVTAAAGIDWNRRKVRKWGVKMREVKGVGGGSWWVRTWVGSAESDYASDPSRILAVPSTLPRPSAAPKPRKTDSSRSIPTIPSLVPVPVPVPAPHPKPRITHDAPALTGGRSHYRDRDQEGVELLTAFASSSRKTEGDSVKGWSTSASVESPSASGSTTGIGRQHYRDRTDGSAHYRDRDVSGSSSQPGPMGGHYRESTRSSGDSTPVGADGVPPPRVVYDLARDGIEEVSPPDAEDKGKGREVENGVVMVNGKGKERARDDGPASAVVVEELVEGRVRSGSGYEQAAKDVEMELMDEP